MYSIGELAEVGQISVRTLRYYDEISLLIPTEIRNGGRRYYSDDAFIRLHYILTLREIGLFIIINKQFVILKELQIMPSRSGEINE